MRTSTKASGAVLAVGLMLAGSALAASSATATTKSYTAAQVARHASPTNCWTIVGKGVYNLTSWVNSHPGGSGPIRSLCGTNGTRAFRAMHGTSADPNTMLARFRVGTLRK